MMRGHRCTRYEEPRGIDRLGNHLASKETAFARSDRPAAPRDLGRGDARSDDGGSKRVKAMSALCLGLIPLRNRPATTADRPLVNLDAREKTYQASSTGLE